MNSKAIVTGFLACCIVIGLMTGCQPGTGTGADADSTKVDTTLKLEMNPDDFPVNKIPDSQFGKVLTETQDLEIVVADGSLPEMKKQTPDWLEAIISRESIVAFGKVMSALPEELEFMQQDSKLMDGSEGWMVFWSSFVTSPSNRGIIVWGACQSEEQCFWASMNRPTPVEMSVTDFKSLGNGQGVRIEGRIGEKGKPHRVFQSELLKESGIIQMGK